MIFCPQCDKEFTSKYTLNRHISNIHKISNSQKENGLEEYEEESVNQESENDPYNKCRNYSPDITSGGTDEELENSDQSEKDSEMTESSDEDEPKYTHSEVSTILHFYKYNMEKCDNATDNESEAESN